MRPRAAPDQQVRAGVRWLMTTQHVRSRSDREGTRSLRLFVLGRGRGALGATTLATTAATAASALSLVTGVMCVSSGDDEAAQLTFAGGLELEPLLAVELNRQRAQIICAQGADAQGHAQLSCFVTEMCGDPAQAIGAATAESIGLQREASAARGATIDGFVQHELQRFVGAVVEFNWPLDLFDLKNDLLSFHTTSDPLCLHAKERQETLGGHLATLHLLFKGDRRATGTRWAASLISISCRIIIARRGGDGIFTGRYLGGLIFSSRLSDPFSGLHRRCFHNLFSSRLSDFCSSRWKRCLEGLVHVNIVSHSRLLSQAVWVSSRRNQRFCTMLSTVLTRM